MSETKFSFAWNAYQKNICSGLSSLQQKGEFVDMTIAADGHLVRVHQMVMSLVSPYIKELIASTECPKPVIFLHNVSHEILVSILDYAYTGEVMVPNKSLVQFLQVCNALQIRGLENLGKNITEIKKDDLLHQVEETNKHPDNIQNDTINLSHDRLGAGAEESTDKNNLNDEISDSDTSIPEQKDASKEDPVFSIPKIDPAKCKLQYCASSQSSLELILNRYIYLCRSAPQEKSKSWQCYNHKKGCNATILTKGDKVVKRSGTHNHGFHDAQILNRVRNKNVTAEIKRLNLVGRRQRPADPEFDYSRSLNTRK